MCDTTDALKFNAVETLHRSKNREHAFAVPNVKVNYLVTEKLEQRLTVDIRTQTTSHS